MKQCQKWWNEEQSEGAEEEFRVKHRGLTTQEQVLDALVETVWRAALDWAKKEAISLDERGDISRGIINRELGS